MEDEVEKRNNLVYAIATRLRQLGNEKIDSLRSIAGYGCVTEHEAIQMNRYMDRGQLLETIIVEEFIEETL